MKQLSVIIVTYNSEKDIYDCLDSVYQYNDIGDDLEVIVVDNQSKEYEAMQLRLSKEYPQVRVVQNTHNGGYGQGNNVGIRIAEAQIVSIMNPDVRLIQPVFKTILCSFDDPQVIMWGCKQKITPLSSRLCFDIDFTRFGIAQVFLRHIMLRLDKYDSRFAWLSGAFFSIRKKSFEQIGLFDEQIFMYGEECDIHLRLRDKFPSKKIVYTPTCSYLHLSGKRFFSDRRYKQLLLSGQYVCQKHHLSPKRYLQIELARTYTAFIRDILQHDLNKKDAYKAQINIIKDMLTKTEQVK